MVTRDPKNRSGEIQAGPDPIDFGLSPLGQTADAVFTIARAPSNALLTANVIDGTSRVTANIIDRTSRGRFRILSLKSAILAEPKRLYGRRAAAESIARTENRGRAALLQPQRTPSPPK